MDISAAGIGLIKEFEGFEARAYQDSVGVWTIGWGHTKGVHPGQVVDQAGATDLLRSDLQWAVAAVNRLVKVSLAQPQFDALVSFVFNLGEGNFAKSTLLRLLNAGDYDGAAQQFAAWDKAGGRVLKGLTRRRAAEAALFRSSASYQPPPIAAPRTSVVTVAEVKIPWWQRIFGAHKPTPPAAKARPGLHPNGSADLWDIQAALKARGYYNTGLLDGLDGGKTQSAIAQIRKDNQLGDGGIDADFLAGLPNWPHAPVSSERAHMSVAEVARHAPEVIKPPAWLATAGAGLLGLGGVDVSGISAKVQTGLDTGTAVVGQVQSAFGLIGTAYEFAVAHQTLLKFALGGLLVWYGVNKVLNGIIKVRQALF